MALYSEHTCPAADGLSLYYRDYAGGPEPAATPVLCIPGLTRNSRDFDFIAGHIARTRRVLAVDLRGRGRSGYDSDPSRYSVPVETVDVLHLIAALGLAKVIVLGTSRGGVIAMTIAAAKPDVLAGAILNDMGAQLDHEGLERIYSVMRSPPNFSGWQQAADALKRYSGTRFPNVTDARWLSFAHDVYREENGRIVGDYDPKFPQAILDGRGTNPRTEDGAANLWKWFQALSAIPTLVLRGENSDLLSDTTVSEMTRAKRDLATVLVKDRGHVPFLDEPEAVAAIDDFLSRIA